jgi:hypothetical protein
MPDCLSLYRACCHLNRKQDQAAPSMSLGGQLLAHFRRGSQSSLTSRLFIHVICSPTYPEYHHRRCREKSFSTCADVKPPTPSTWRVEGGRRVGPIRTWIRLCTLFRAHNTAHCASRPGQIRVFIGWSSLSSHYAEQDEGHHPQCTKKLGRCSYFTGWQA